MRPILLAILFHVGVVGVSGMVWAQNPPPPSTVPTATNAGPSAADLAEAKRQFEKGLELYDQQAFAAALPAFQRSRELAPRLASSTNIARCLRELKRFDEALLMYEVVLRDFEKEIEPKEKLEIQTEIEKLRSYVGIVEINGAQIGATITIDGQFKGDYPPVVPIRTSAGTHVVRVFKEDFEPYEERVDVNGGATKTIDIKMRPLAASGRLRVVEQSGRTIDVYIDGVKTGKTPWEGRLGVGRHTVTLVGPNNFGTQPASVDVKPQQIETLKLPGKTLDASLQVTPSPIDAKVAIDNVEVGIGTWSGRLNAGKHKIDVYKDGFVAESRMLVLEPGGRPQLAIAIERDQNSVVWKLPSLVVFEISTGFAISPSFGGDVLDTSCTTGCVSSPALGSVSRLSVAYERQSKLTLGADFGFLYARQSVQNREVKLVPVGFNAQPGRASDTIQAYGPMLGVHVGYRGLFMKGWPFGLRLGAGAFLSHLRDDRIAKGFSSTQPDIGSPRDVVASNVDRSATYVYANPEAYAGFRIGNHFELGAILGAIVAYSWEQPKYDPLSPIRTIVPATQNAVTSMRQTYATYEPETLTGPIIFSGVVGLRARADF